MGFFSFFRRPERRPPTPRVPTGATGEPVDLGTALSVLGQESPDWYRAPSFSVSGQPQYWVWAPKAFANALPGTWQANWNALPVCMRPFYGMALDGGVSKGLLRQIYEEHEGNYPAAGADLVNKMHENGRSMSIYDGRLFNSMKNSDGTATSTVIAKLAYPEAPTSVGRL